MLHYVADSLDFIRVPRKRILLEDGSEYDVPEFVVSQTCVSIRLFALFQEEVGYVTTSENNHYKSYSENEMIEHFEPGPRALQTAFCMSFADADAFCKWAGLRLPSEAEWIASSIIDTEIYDRSKKLYPSWCGPDGRYPAVMPKSALVLEHREITSTTEEDFIIARAGPKYYRDVRWKEQAAYNRLKIKSDEVDIFNSFRVCLL